MIRGTAGAYVTETTGGVPCETNVAVTDRLASISTLQLPVPAQAPLHPVNVLPESATAVRVTLVPDWYGAEQLIPQLIPAGLLETVPAPVPSLATVSWYVGMAAVTLSVAPFEVALPSVFVAMQRKTDPLSESAAGGVVYEEAVAPGMFTLFFCHW